MIELSTMIMSKKVKYVNLFLLKKTNTEKYLSEYFYKTENVNIYKLTYVDKILFKIGVVKNKYRIKILESDLIFIHNFKLIRYLKFILNFKTVILFFHTDKVKQIRRFKNIKKIFTVNNHTMNLINKTYGKNKATFLPNSIDIENKKYVFKKINKKIIIGAMGRLVEKKGFRNLINIFKKFNEIELRIAGDGPQMKVLRKNIKGHSNIKLLGWVDDKDKFFSKIDFFFSSSSIEPFGLVILEAMVRSTPVISTKCKGPLDIIDHMSNGILINIDNVDEIKNSIKLLKRNNEFRKKISKNGFDTVKKRYSTKVYEKNFFSEIIKI